MRRLPCTPSGASVDASGCPLGDCQLLRNPGFEKVPNNDHEQGIMPNDWVTIPVIAPGADTYSNDGAYGLPPDDVGNFTGVLAVQGKRWVAGWSAAGEDIAQDLSTPLVPGHRYRLNAALHQSPRYDNAGSYRVTLRDAADVTLFEAGSFSRLFPRRKVGWDGRSNLSLPRTPPV